MQSRPSLRRMTSTRQNVHKILCSQFEHAARNDNAIGSIEISPQLSVDAAYYKKSIRCHYCCANIRNFE